MAACRERQDAHRIQVYVAVKGLPGISNMLARGACRNTRVARCDATKCLFVTAIARHTHIQKGSKLSTLILLTANESIGGTSRTA